jgi:hypothetical protein
LGATKYLSDQGLLLKAPVLRANEPSNSCICLGNLFIYLGPGAINGVSDAVLKVLLKQLKGNRL